MKIRTMLTLQYAGLTTAVFLVFVIAVYYVSEHSRSNAFFRNLQSEAITKAHLFLNNQVDAATMQSIYLNNRQFINEVEVAVYTPDFRILYHDALQNDIIKETPEMVTRILKRKTINFYVNEYQAVGLVYTFEGKEYIVTAAAYDGYGYANRDALRNMLILLFIGGLTILAVVGYILAKSTLKPIRSIVKEAENITASHIDKRLPVKNEQDELGELCIAFNNLLERLEKSFNSQKMFVSNVSHELRTPMAALTAELDLALLKERTAEQYQSAIGNALQDTHRIIKLIDGLLNLAKADYQSEQIKMEEVRLDELLLDARELVLKAHPEYHVELVFDQEAENDNVLTVVGNNYLLTTAFVNLIENNCKYSSNRSSFVLISFWEQSAVIRLSDNGVGISDKDKENLFRLFYRGENKAFASGHGIGMTLTQKIIHLHKGELTVSSHQGEGTTFVVKLSHI
ncbi:ATP-binding protein [uncultured Bacteroides sp.]|uniref:HAMP domain-containing sensor histidine kinase n=1 Tax=uncultured Bacteroides sp. TaxID=162156 RepID=UPI0027DEA9F2|nr:ATP-binding protein [uncultured Bacteroides sp.]